MQKSTSRTRNTRNIVYWDIVRTGRDLYPAQRRVSLPVCQLTACLPACLPESLPACQPASLPACQLDNLPAWLTSCLPVSLPTCQSAYSSACLPACQPAWLTAYLTDSLPVWQPAYLSTGLPTSLSVSLTVHPYLSCSFSLPTSSHTYLLISVVRRWRSSHFPQREHTGIVWKAVSDGPDKVN